MPKRDHALTAAIASATLAKPPAPPPIPDPGDDGPVSLMVLDDIWRNPDPEDGAAVEFLDGLLLLMATTTWAELSDENHQGLIESIEHTVSIHIPGYKIPSVCGSVRGVWGPIGGAVMARCIEHLAIADSVGFTDSRSRDRAEDIRQLWIRQQRFRPNEQALIWARRALDPHLEQAQAEVDSWPTDRLEAARERLEELR